ncbi:MAG: Glycosyltransferase [Stygiobacter sp.]|nr:MAG: Glycosyltransferase [Stygiobacter sp.]KAF0216899.1 MAG: hypothetical protein FD178_929 [Ignavibacteria bacterium]
MKIAIDARVLNKGITGTGRYLMNILDGLQSCSSTHDFYLLTSNIELFNGSNYKIIPIKEPKHLDKVYSPFWLNILLPKLLKELDFDIYFTTNILVPIVNLPKTKRISVVHDVIHKVHKQYYPLSYRAYLDLFLPRSLKLSDRIITVSEHSKMDISRYYKIDLERISIVHANGATNLRPLNSAECVDIERIRKKYNLPQKFILFVGSLENRKNIVSLIKIAEKLNIKGIDLPLVLIGKPGYGFNQYKKTIDENSRFVKHLGFVDDQDLVYIYNAAFALVFPSFYEGFGIPPLEAMKCGVPVLASNTSSLPEVIGTGGILVDPTDIDGFVDELIKLHSDNNYYLMMKTRGLERSQIFSIKKSAEALIKIFDNINKTI